MHAIFFLLVLNWFKPHVQYIMAYPCKISSPTGKYIPYSTSLLFGSYLYYMKRSIYAKAHDDVIRWSHVSGGWGKYNAIPFRNYACLFFFEIVYRLDISCKECLTFLHQNSMLSILSYKCKQMIQPYFSLACNIHNKYIHIYMYVCKKIANKYW